LGFSLTNLFILNLLSLLSPRMTKRGEHDELRPVR
jgi:hypothetical protein